MDKKTREQLDKAGKRVLFEIYDLNKTGYAGILNNGNIVDRRMYPKAIAIPANKLFNLVEPKELDLKNLSLEWRTLEITMDLVGVYEGYIEFNDEQDIINFYHSDPNLNRFFVTKENVESYVNNFNQ